MALVMLAFNTGLQGIPRDAASGKSGAAVDQLMHQVGIGDDFGRRENPGPRNRNPAHSRQSPTLFVLLYPSGLVERHSVPKPIHKPAIITWPVIVFEITY